MINSKRYMAKEILVIDDSKHLNDILTRALGTEGFKVTACETGKAGLAYLDQHPDELPSIVLLDYSLPGMSGDEVARQIKANERISQVPLILITIHTTVEEQVPDIARLFKGILYKPFSLKDLLATIYHYS